MSINIFLEHADERQIPSLIDLGRLHYPLDHHALSVNFYRWFYLSNPFGNAIIVKSAVDGMLVGMIALIPIELQNRELIQRACFAVNVLTHPEFRGKHLFAKMIKCAESYLSEQNIWLLGHPNSSAFPGWKRGSMKFTDPLQLFVTKPAWTGINSKLLVSSKQLEQLPGEWWESVQFRSGWHVRYTSEFLSWRFFSSPVHRYRISAIQHRDNILGLRITRRLKGPIDLLLDPVCNIENMGRVIRSCFIPSVLLHSGTGSLAQQVERACVRLPLKRTFPVFVADWHDDAKVDLSGLTLSATDF